MADPTTSTTYDDTPYPSSSFPDTHPDRLAGLARLFGLQAPLPSSARVLELGCADGSNLLPMAAHAPDARFVGIDASKVQIAAGLRAVAAAGLRNVELRAQNLLEFGPAEGEFDYIIAHGIYSWVPAPVRDKMLKICQQQLHENGVAFISYNALPGWNLRRSLRGMMLFHARNFSDPATKVQQARALLGFLAESVPAENAAYHTLLKNELATLNKREDSYLLHEMLEEDNTPFYFHEFVSAADRHELRYLAESRLAAMLASRFPDRVTRMLSQSGLNMIAQEQYMDFLKNRTFRQTLLCRKDRTLVRNIRPAQLHTLAFRACLKPMNTKVDFTPGASVTVETIEGHRVTSSDPHAKALLRLLLREPASAITYANLLKSTRITAGTRDGAENSGADDPAAEAFGSMLIHLLATGVVEPLAEPSVCAAAAPERPAVSPLARYQAANSRVITSRVHRSVHADKFVRTLVGLCDGTRGRGELVQQMVRHAVEGAFVVSEGRHRISEPNRLTSAVASRVDGILDMLAQNGFFPA